ncbi:MAG: bifunctional nuclease family protein [Bacteroidales bacterium]|jgi:bifunctional DNase/RNase|nr:bifunctional nuclease family protein [Bacteroidales bacterium]
MSKIKLNVLGISYSQTQTGAYALVLTEENGDRRIPIIIGGFEAQAIAIQLEGLKPPRPLTHDLFLNFATSFGINLLEVNIYRLEEGVFYSQLICNNGKNNISIDARTSDAIALALRFKCPIYTTEEILQKSGIVIDIESEEKVDPQQTSGDDSSNKTDSDISSMSRYEFEDLDIEALETLLEEAVKKEEYERASIIRDEINKRKKDQ